MGNKIDKPHDHFFRATFSKVLVAKAFIEKFLPKEISTRLQLSTLQLENGSYVDDELSENITDLVYSCQWNGKQEVSIEISFLFEHKSWVPKYPHLQLFRYLLNAWEQQYQNSEDLVIIIPIIVYHGGRKWKYKPFKDYFPYEDEQLNQFIPKFEYLLTDLSNHSDEELNKIKLGFLGAALLLMKNNKNPNFIRNKTTELFIYAWKSTPSNLFETFVRIAVVYIANASPIEKEEIRKIANNLPLKLDDMVKTAYEQFVEEGILIGRIKGEKIGEKKKELLTVLQLIKTFPLMNDGDIAKIATTEKATVNKIRKEYPITDKKKYTLIIQTLLKAFPSFKNKELAILFEKTSVAIQKIRKAMPKEKPSNTKN